MVKLYLVRHGETIWNIERKMQGGMKDSPLTEKGIEQANLLKNRVQDINFDIIYSSPLERAVKTSRIVAAQRNIPIIKDDRLMEIDIGEWGGLTKEQAREKNPEQLDNFWTNPKIYVPDTGESFAQVKTRVVSLIKEIISRYEGKSILIVTHTVVLRIMMAYFENRPLDELWEGSYIHQASLSEVEIESGCYNILLYGDTSHLGEIKSVNTI
ncbi:histidine phosphatase family protein [Clostridium sp. WILCCON 0269]|uniref:Histidine phosphatase family protein n=1 Tax=Candidatus Clostridium eludens TaxID=3381663 RepID=A0ABW8SJK5_9CLOT